LIAIAGGGLQGVETSYLARKAGWEVMVIDKKPDPPARGLSDIFVQADLCLMDQASVHLNWADLILPALENEKALETLNLWQNRLDAPVCFDFNSYALSSSKQKSNNLFSQLEIPRPMEWPHCDFPVVLKPGIGSGSQGVQIINSKNEWPDHFDDQNFKKEWVVEEYITGPSYSLEIIGGFARYETLQVTELMMDKTYDCKRVVAPALVDQKFGISIENSARAIAREMKLYGIMDFEVILHQGKMKMLEIDARFPSQTPMAVYASTGINMVEILTDLALHQKLDPVSLPENPDHAVVEHIEVTPRGIAVKGENIMKSQGSLHLQTDFFGADEALTSFVKGSRRWVATMIYKGKNRRDVMKKRDKILKKMGQQLNLTLVKEINPYAPA